MIEREMTLSIIWTGIACCLFMCMYMCMYIE